MQTPASAQLDAWRAQLRHPGFCFVAADQMQSALSAAACDSFPAFAQSWNNLELDHYMADAGRYRKRRHGVFLLDSSAEQPSIRPLAPQPHYQSLEYNALNGGIARYFAQIEPAQRDSPVFEELLTLFARLVKPLCNDVKNWRAEAHQFRIEPTPEYLGQPTPEGMHRDGVDFVLVLMIARENIEAGTTSVHIAGGLEVGNFTLKLPFEAVWLDDNRLFHGVTAVHPKNPDLPAYRDVLVLTLKASTEAIDG